MALPTSGQITLAQIRDEVSPGTTSNVSLRALSSAAGFSTPDTFSEFYGYSAVSPMSFRNGSESWFSFTSTGSGTSSTDPFIITSTAPFEDFTADLGYYYVQQQVYIYVPVDFPIVMKWQTVNSAYSASPGNYFAQISLTSAEGWNSFYIGAAPGSGDCVSPGVLGTSGTAIPNNDPIESRWMNVTFWSDSAYTRCSSSHSCKFWWEAV